MDITALPPLTELSESDRRESAARCRLIRAPAGTLLYEAGQACRHFLIVIEGAITVGQTTEGGRLIVLYHLGAGQACALTTMALLGTAPPHHVAAATADSDAQVLAMPAELFKNLIARNRSFLAFALTACAERFDDLLRRIDSLSQHRIDLRLAQTLVAQSALGPIIHTSHEALAAEVGTAREVVSRHLADFQRLGLIERHRGQITIRDRAGLQTLLRVRD